MNKTSHHFILLNPLTCLVLKVHFGRTANCFNWHSTFLGTVILSTEGLDGPVSSLVSIEGSSSGVHSPAWELVKEDRMTQTSPSATRDGQRLFSICGDTTGSI